MSYSQYLYIVKGIQILLPSIYRILFNIFYLDLYKLYTRLEYLYPPCPHVSFELVTF